MLLYLVTWQSSLWDPVSSISVDSLELIVTSTITHCRVCFCIPRRNFKAQIFAFLIFELYFFQIGSVPGRNLILSLTSASSVAESTNQSGRWDVMWSSNAARHRNTSVPTVRITASTKPVLSNMLRTYTRLCPIPEKSTSAMYVK